MLHKKFSTCFLLLSFPLDSFIDVLNTKELPRSQHLINVTYVWWKETFCRIVLAHRVLFQFLSVSFVHSFRFVDFLRKTFGIRGKLPNAA